MMLTRREQFVMLTPEQFDSINQPLLDAYSICLDISKALIDDADTWQEGPEGEKKQDFLGAWSAFCQHLDVLKAELSDLTRGDIRAWKIEQERAKQASDNANWW